MMALDLILVHVPFPTFLYQAMRCWQILSCLLFLMAVQCHPDCLVCSQSFDHCDICRDATKQLQNGRCVENCESGFYKDAGVCLGIAKQMGPAKWIFCSVHRSLVGRFFRDLFFRFPFSHICLEVENLPSYLIFTWNQGIRLHLISVASQALIWPLNPTDFNGSLN